MKLYNTTVRVVELVWADSPEDAVLKLTRTVNRARLDAEVIDGDAFLSEPVESHGWDGEQRQPTEGEAS